MKRHEKLILSGISIFIAVFFLTVYNSLSYHQPWLFGFLTSPNTVPPNTLGNYVISMHEKSLLFVTFGEVISAVTGLSFKWFALPGMVLVTVAVYAFASPLSTSSRVLLSVGATFGPISIVNITFRLSRDMLDLLFIYLFLVITVVLARKKQGQLFGPVFLVTSLLLWINHYTIWPFVAVMMVTFIALSRGTYIKRASTPVYLLFIIAPFAIYATPATSYVSFLPALLAMISGDGQISIDLVQSRSVSMPADATVLPGLAPPTPPWMPEGVFLIFGLGLGLLGIIWLAANIRLILARGISNALSVGPEDGVYRRLFLAVVIAFGVTAGLLVLRGYLSRVFFFWPVMLPVFVVDLRNSLVEMPSLNWSTPIQVTQSTVGLALFIIVLGTALPIATPLYIDGGERAAFANQKQVTSSKWSQHAESQIRTDLLHASVIYLATDQRDVLVGSANYLPNGSIVVDKRASELYRPSGTDGVTLVTTAETDEMVIWGGSVPNASVYEHRLRNRIYMNGHDSWYT